MHNVLLSMEQLLLALSAATLYGVERQLVIPANLLHSVSSKHFSINYNSKCLDVPGVFCVDAKCYDTVGTPVSCFSTQLFLRITEYHNFNGSVTSVISGFRLTPEDGTDRLSRNFGKKLSLLAA
jgi:hypothetical protein